MPDSKFIEFFDKCLDQTGYSENTKIGILFYVGFMTTGLSNEYFPKDEKKITDCYHLYSYAKNCPPINNAHLVLFVDFALSHPYQDIETLTKYLEDKPSFLRSDFRDGNNHFYKISEHLDKNLNSLHTYHILGLETLGSLIYREGLSYGDYLLHGQFLAANMSYFETESFYFVMDHLKVSQSPLLSGFNQIYINYLAYPEEVLSNHLFSVIFREFCRQVGSPDFAKEFILKWHQHLFYSDYGELRDLWDFQEPYVNTMNKIFDLLNDLRTKIDVKEIEEFRKLDEFLLPELKNKVIHLRDLEKVIQKKIISEYWGESKYGMLFVEKCRGADQMLSAGILYYHYFRHVMIAAVEYD